MKEVVTTMDSSCVAALAEVGKLVCHLFVDSSCSSCEGCKVRKWCGASILTIVAMWDSSCEKFY